MANTKPYEIIAGPLYVFFAPTTTASPTTMSDEDLIAGSTDWIYVGYTEGGVKVASPQTVVELRADQVTAPVKAVRSEEALESPSTSRASRWRTTRWRSTAHSTA